MKNNYTFTIKYLNYIHFFFVNNLISKTLLISKSIKVLIYIYTLYASFVSIIQPKNHHKTI